MTGWVIIGVGLDGFQLESSPETRRTVLETTAQVTRIHVTEGREGATEKRNPGQGEIHSEAERLEPGARRATLAAKQLVDCRAASAPLKRGRGAADLHHC